MAERGGISLDEFKARLPLVDIVARHVRLTRRGREHMGLCPFHAEKTPSFTLSEAKGFYHCFGCGQHGNAIDFVMAVEGLEFGQAVSRLVELTGLPAPRQAGPQAPPVDRSLLAANEAAQRWFAGRLASPEGSAARAYLAGRGLEAPIIERFGLGYAPDLRGALGRALGAEGFDVSQLVEVGLLGRADDGTAHDRFRHRIMFPIADARGRIVGFGGRALGAAKAKYLNTAETPLFKKGELLYGQALARAAIRSAGTVIVAEGYMDVIALARAGFGHAVAPLGTAVGEAQLTALWHLADEPVVCLDGDEAGLRAAQRLIERGLPLLQPGRSLRFAVLPPGEDPDSLLRSRGRAMLAQVLDETIPLEAFLWARETATCSLAVAHQRAALEQRFRQLAGSIPDRRLGRLFLDAFFRRLRAATPAGPRSQRRPGALAPNPAASVGSARLAARFSNPTSAVERELLGPVVVHPALLGEIEEELAGLAFAEPGLEALRQAILSWYGQHGHLDPAGLRTHLSGSGFAGAVAQLTAPGPATAWYSDPDVATVAVLAAWRARVRSHLWFQAKRRARSAVGEAIAGGRESEAGIGALSVARLINDPATNETRRRDRLMD